MGLPLAEWMPIVMDLLQVATSVLPRCYGYRNREFSFCWGYWCSTTFSLYFMSLFIFHTRKNPMPVCKKPWLAHLSSHLIGSSDPRGASGRFRLGPILGNLFVAVISTRFNFLSFSFFSGFCFCTSRIEKPAVLV